MKKKKKKKKKEKKRMKIIIQMKIRKIKKVNMIIMKK